jgi:membrane protease subunit HflK
VSGSTVTAGKDAQGGFVSETVIHNLRDTVKRTGGYARWILRILILVYAASGIYIVKSHEIGVVQRFGRVVDASIRPGIHYALPRPIDRVDTVPVKLVQQIQLDTFTQEADPKSVSSQFYTLTGLPSYCISGDNNIVTVSYFVKYTIIDPVKYLFSASNTERLLQSLAASSLIHTLSKLPVDEILTFGKRGIESSLREELQHRLDDAGSGLGVSFIELRSVSPPKVVQKYFDDVINAGIDRKKMVHQAESYRSEQLADARGRAERMRQEALAYRNDQIARAEGEAKRFLSQLEELRGGDKVTKQRLYFEFIQAIFPGLENVIVVNAKDGKQLIHLKIFPPRSSGETRMNDTR